jgi:nucleoside-diphosphate-sugar epimerase
MAEARKLATAYTAAIRQAGVKRVVHLSSVGAHLAQGNGVLAFHHLAENIFRELPAEVSITHLRPVGFYTNLFNFKDMIKGEGLLGRFLALRYSGLRAMLTGKTGIIAANYGAGDKLPWVSPVDIAAAAAEELTAPLAGRNVRYVASEELTCNEIASILGQAIGKPYLQWALMSDKQMQSGLEMFKVPKERAVGIVEMNAAMHSGLVDEDYYRHRPVLGKVKMADFAKEFAAVYHQG